MAGTYKSGNAVTPAKNSEEFGGQQYRFIKSSRVSLTLQLAEELLAADAVFIADRALMNGHVDDLLNKMTAGEFAGELTDLAVCHFNGKKIRVNGQHTCWARSSMPAEYELYVNYLEYEAESEDGVRALYSIFDRNKARTRSNVIDSYLAGSEGFEAFSADGLRMIAKGLTLYLSHNDPSARKSWTPEAISIALRFDYNDVAVSIAGFLSSCNKGELRHMWRAPVFAAFFATFKKTRSESVNFWTKVADGTELKKGDSRLTLRNYLTASTIDQGIKNGAGKKSVNAEEMYRACILAWNAHREGRELSVLKTTPGKKRPGAR